MYENSACGSVDIFMSRANVVPRERSKARQTRVLGEEWRTQAEGRQEGPCDEGELSPGGGAGSLGV